MCISLGCIKSHWAVALVVSRQLGQLHPSTCFDYQAQLHPSTCFDFQAQLHSSRCLASFGLMHMFATNICILVRAVVKETVRDVTSRLRHVEYSGGSGGGGDDSLNDSALNYSAQVKAMSLLCLFLFASTSKEPV